MSFNPTLIFLAVITLLSFTSYYVNKDPPSPSQASQPPPESFLTLPTPTSFNSSQYKFGNPLVAHFVISQLDPPINVEKKFHEGFDNWTEASLMIPNDQYCQKALAYFVENPQSVFDQMNFLAFYRSALLRNDVIGVIGNDLHPNFRYKKDKSKMNTTKFELDPTMNIAFIWNSLSPEWEINKHIACTHQLYNQVLDSNSIYFKTRLDQYYKDYSDFHQDEPQCLPSFMPESFLLDNKTQCTQFFSYMNSAQYKKLKNKHGVVFLKKVGALMHAGKGVELVDDSVEEDLKGAYKNGALCGTIPDNYQLQRYINNPLLVFGHKFDLRVYMLVASVNPLIVYYHDGNIRVSLHDYDPKSDDKAAHLTNTHLSMDIFDIVRKEGSWKGMDKDELMNFQSWNYTRLQSYLLENGKVPDSNWLENSLRYQMKKAMVHIVRMTKQNFLKRSNMFQMMGLDFLLDDEMKVWFIEANKKPGMDRYNDVDAEFQRKMLKDLFEVMFSYLRSRVKRVVNYVNKVSLEVESEGDLERTLIGKIGKFEERKKEFDRINKNYLEPEYGIPSGNGFVRIMDENESGKERFGGLIPEEC